MTFGKRVNKLRLEKGLTISKLSAMTNIARSTIADLESGKNHQVEKAYLPLAKTLGVSVMFLMYGKKTRREKILKNIESIEEKFKQIKSDLIES
jgi:transcriptional regulator with XRE-family HTH domain